MEEIYSHEFISRRNGDGIRGISWVTMKVLMLLLVVVVVVVVHSS